MNKKSKIIILLTIAILAFVCCAFLYINKRKIRKNKISEIYKYGNKLETMDILPNTIVARFNGQEILFREVETSRKSINYSKEKNTEAEEKNAFYEVLVKKLYIEFAKKYPDEVEYNLDIERNLEKTEDEWLHGYGEKDVEEYRQEWLDALCVKQDEIWLNEGDFLKYLQSISINQMLEVKGSQIIFKFMLDKPELAKDTKLEEKVKLYKDLQEKKEITEATQLLLEINDLYIKDLILNSNIEFCVDKNELYTQVPEIYSENQTVINDNESGTTSNLKNFDENIKIAYSDDSKFIYYNNSIKDQYNWNNYIIENKTITKNMPEIDFSKFEKLDDEFYSLKITELEEYNEYATRYGLRKLDQYDFKNIFVNIIIRKNNDYNISYEDIITGYENFDDDANKGEKNFTFPIKVGSKLESAEDLKYPCIVGYFPNYMCKNYSSFFFKILPLKSNIKISSSEALQIAKNYLQNLSYSGIDDFNDMDYLRITNEYENNFLNTDNKEHPTEDSSKQHSVWSISAYSNQDPCTWVNVYIDITTGKIIGGKLNFATD